MVAQLAFPAFFDTSASDVEDLGVLEVQDALDALEGLHADVWRAHALALAPQRTVATGDALLDQHLPGGGWPVGALTELLQAPGVHNEWRLLAPALACCGVGPVVLVAPPHLPFAPALAAQGVAARRLLWFKLPSSGSGSGPGARGAAVQSASATPLWATEQALRCAPVDAVLAWLPQARADQLRRLQLAAAEHHKLLFVMRSDQARKDASPAVLRLLLSADADGGLCIDLLKRRGPPLENLLHLAARAPALRQLLAAATPAQPELRPQAALCPAHMATNAADPTIVPATIRLPVHRLPQDRTRSRSATRSP
jgi:protein ImuA